MNTSPHDYADRFLDTFQLQLLNIGGATMAIALLTGAVAVRENRAATTLLLGGAAGMSILGYEAARSQTRNTRTNLDVTDISDQVRQQLTFEGLSSEGRSPIGGNSPVVIMDAPTEGFDFSTFGTEAESASWDALLLRAIESPTPVISIVGPQGTYKTTLINYLAGILDSHVIVLDPHAARSDWPGCDVVGRGMAYDEISKALKDAMALTKHRYQERATNDVREFERVTYICEEMTNWAAQVEGVAEFGKSSLSDFRKAGQQVIKVAHGETNTAQGGSKGTAKMRVEGEILIKLTAPGIGTITFPGSGPLPLEFPDLRNFTRPAANKPTPADLAAIAGGGPQHSGTYSAASRTAAATTIKVEGSDDISIDAAQHLYTMISARLGEGDTKSKILKDYLGFAGDKYSQGCRLWTALTKEFGAFS